MTCSKLFIQKQNAPSNMVIKGANFLTMEMVSDKAAFCLLRFSIFILNEIPFPLDEQDTDPIVLPNGSSALT